MISIPWFFPVLFVTLSACSTSKGFDRPGIYESLHQRPPVAGEHEPTDSPAQRIALPEPFRLGVYFVHTELPTRRSVRTVEWLSAERDRLIQRLAPLRSDQIVHDVILLAEPTVLNPTIRELRLAAGRYGMDALLIIDGIGAVDRFNNAYSVLYPTIIGAWLAPGTVSDALFVLDGTLWDLRSDTTLDRLTAEGRAQRTGPAILVEDTDVLTEAKHRAIDAFGAQFVEHLRALKRRQSVAPASLR